MISIRPTAENKLCISYLTGEVLSNQEHSRYNRERDNTWVDCWSCWFASQPLPSDVILWQMMWKFQSLNARWVNRQLSVRSDWSKK